MVDDGPAFKYQCRVVYLLALATLAEHSTIASHLVQLLVKQCLLHLFDRTIFTFIFVEVRVQLDIAID